MDECKSPQWNYTRIEAHTYPAHPAVLVVSNLQRNDLQHIKCVDSVVGTASPKQSAVVFRGNFSEFLLIPDTLTCVYFF